MDKNLVMELELKYSESQEIQKRLEAIDEQMMELRVFQEGIMGIGNSKENRILAPLGKGVFIPAEIREREFFVGIGGGIFLKRRLADTNKSVEEQIENFSRMKNQLAMRLSELQNEMEKIVRDLDEG